MPDCEYGPAWEPLQRLGSLAASGSARAQGLPPEQVRALGARRRRRRIATTAVAASVVVAVMAGGAVAVAGQLDGTSRTPQPAESPSPSLAPPSPTRPEKGTPGSRPGHGGVAVERSPVKGAQRNAGGRAAPGNQPSIGDGGRPATRPTPRAPAPPPDAPPPDQSQDQPPTYEPPTEAPPTEEPTEPPPTDQPPTEAPPTEQPPTEQPPAEQPSTTG